MIKIAVQGCPEDLEVVWDNKKYKGDQGVE